MQGGYGSSEGRVHIDQSRYWGCIGCGHCMTICPHGCIIVEGRDLSPSDLLELPAQAARAGYEPFYALLLSRRSTRAFQDREVGREVIDKILRHLRSKGRDARAGPWATGGSRAARST